MALCLQRKASIRKLICNKKTKELHLDKIKRLILVWLFYGRPSLRLLLLTSFWESCLSWQTKTFVEAFMKLESVSKYLNKRQKKKKNHCFTLFLQLVVTRKYVFYLSDHALVGHVIQNNVVVDEFECQLKCMGNNSCKSINVHPGDSNGKRSCELNNKTRQMKPGHFKKKKDLHTIALFRWVLG